MFKIKLSVIIMDNYLRGLTMKKILLFMFINLFMINFVVFSNEDTNQVDVFLKCLKSKNIFKRIETAKKITNSGLSNPELFDFIEETLLLKYNLSIKKEHIDEMAWFCKALSSSGNDIYKETLLKIKKTARSSKLKKYAKQSYNLVDYYKKRNNIFSDTSNIEDDLSKQEIKFINMLKSEDKKLKRDAAKLITRAVTLKKEVYIVLEKELLNIIIKQQFDTLSMDTACWMSKALASSGDRKYIRTLKALRKLSNNLKIDRYVKQSLEYLESLE